MMKFFLHFFFAHGLKFPQNAQGGVWKTSPVLQPYHECRATNASILLAWSLARHSIDQLDHYQVRIRWPLAVEINDHSLDLQAPWVKEWSLYFPVYAGPGRQWTFDTSQVDLGSFFNQRIFEFSVRAVTLHNHTSEWSPPVLMHTLLDPSLERFSLDLVGTGRNNAGYSSISVAGKPVFNRTDLDGFALAVFDRADFSLSFMDTYSVSWNDSESLRMANDIRRTAAGPDKFIAVVSGESWEWKSFPVLTKTLEIYGAFYVTQWTHVFSNHVQPSPYADLPETASQDSFGHPYAFVGSAGWGPGNGYESLQLNTGHYLSTGKSQVAKIRLGVYYNYRLGRYFIDSGNQELLSHDFFTKAQLPKPGSLHNPVPLRINADIQISLQSKFAPYVGNLWNLIDYVLEANETVVLDSLNASNSGFEIVQNFTFLSSDDNNPLITEDPRPSARKLSELERVWGGPSSRYSQVTGTLLRNSVDVSINRICPSTFLSFPYIPCEDCFGSASPAPLMEFGIGLFPTKCNDPLLLSASTTETTGASMIPRSVPPPNNITVTADVWSIQN